MSNKFAKLYELPEIGQVLIQKCTKDGRPMVKYTLEHEGVQMGVGPSWEDDHAGWDERDEYFDLINEEEAVLRACPLMEELRFLVKQQNDARAAEPGPEFEEAEIEQ